MGAFEAAGLGNPVLVTGWGGALDYLHGLPDSLVDYHVVPAVDAQEFGESTAQQYWAEVDHDDAIERMRAFYSNPTIAKRLAQDYSAVLQEEFSSSRIGQNLIMAILD